jgi:hypothetical protein
LRENKGYSAYMLFYVREDAIGNVFASCELGEVPEHVRTYADERADVKDIESETITIRAYTEEGLKRNCLTAAMGLWSRHGYFEFSIALNETLEELYKICAMKTLMPDFRGIRIHKFGSGMSQLGAVIDCSKRERIASLTSKNIFVVSKLVKDALALQTTEITIFVKIYTGSPFAPLVYFGASLVGRDEAISDYLYTVSNDIQLPVTEPWCVFAEDPGSSRPILPLETYQSWAANFCYNGTVIVVQSSKVLQHVAESYKLESVADDEPTDYRDALPLMSYFMLMVNHTPDNFQAYFELRADTVDIRLCIYETLTPVKILRVPRRRSLEELCQFVVLAHGEELAKAPKTAKLLLFANRDKTQVPQPDPIASITPININFESLFFLVAEKGGSRFQKTLVVEWSDDSYHFTWERAFFVDMPHDFPVVKRAMAAVIGTQKQTRILAIRHFTISGIYQESD